ncbi:MAG: hypothetical protein LBR53_09465 [Deltaproteobacteria bacterium]|jgi:hypothetical protein|nr:hypothetical protein [Deltaproteobacteria bacterium]
MDFETFFGLRERPFKSPPQEKFFQSREYFPRLVEALVGEGPPKNILLLGPPGSGRTLSLKCLPYALGERFRVAILQRGSPNLRGILGECLASLGLSGSFGPGDPEETLLGIFQSAVAGLLDEGPGFILAADDLLPLTAESVSDMEDLLRLEPAWEGRVALILCSSEEKLPLFASLKEKPLTLRIPPLGVEEIRNYLSGRLRAAGASERIFLPESERLVWKHSGGIPLEVNRLAERSLMTAWAAGKKEVAIQHVASAKMSLDNPVKVKEEGARKAGGKTRKSRPEGRSPSRAPLLALGAVLTAALVCALFPILSERGPGPAAALSKELPAEKPKAGPAAIPAAAPEPSPYAPDIGLPSPPAAILSLPRNALALVVDRGSAMSRLWQGGLNGPGLKAEVAIPGIEAPGLYLVGRPQSRTPLIFQYPPAKEIPKEASLRLWKQVESFLPQDILPLVVGNGPDLKKGAPPGLALAIRERLKIWTQSQEMKRPEDLSALYAPEFKFFEPGRKDRSVVRENFRQALASEMRSSGDVELTLSEPLILLDPRDHDRIWAVFSLKYDSRLRHDIGLRTLVFERGGNGWLIGAELWIREVNLKT